MKWYFLLFLRAINLVSRKKEYRADELACLVAGRKPLIDGLRAIHGGSPAWPVYWNSELLPMVRDGVVPGIAEGFTRFIFNPGIQSQIESHLAKELAEAKSNPYDSHPPLRDRIAAVQHIPERGLQENTLPARSLLDHADAVEVKFLESLNPKLKPGSLTSIPWDIVGEKITIPGWREFASEYSRLLRNVTSESLPDQIPNLRNVGFEIRDPKGMLLSPEQRTERAASLFAVGLGLALLDDGWMLHQEPGVFYLQHNSDQVNPFAIVKQLRSGTLSGSDWRTRCREVGIAGLSLWPGISDSGDGL
jgi:heat shock protein HtpX